MIFALAAIVLIAVFSAFSLKTTKPQTQQSFATKNFVYNLYPDDDPSKISNPANYSLTTNGGMDPLNCPTGSHRCGVVAVDDGTGHPDFSQSFTIRTKN